MSAKKPKSVAKPAIKNNGTPGTTAQTSMVGSMRDTVLWYGDLISPIDVEWDADK
jgi:hypothetical protein